MSDETVSATKRIARVSALLVVVIGIPLALFTLVDPLHYQVRYTNPLDGGMRLEFATERWSKLPGRARRYRVFDAQGALIAEMGDYDPEAMGVRGSDADGWRFLLPDRFGGAVPLRRTGGGELILDEPPSGR